MRASFADFLMPSPPSGFFVRISSMTGMQMKPNRSSGGNGAGRSPYLGRLAGIGALLVGVSLVTGCGGDDGSPASSTLGVNQTTLSAQTTANQAYVDPVAYSPNATDSLAASQVSEQAAV